MPEARPDDASTPSQTPPSSRPDDQGRGGAGRPLSRLRLWIFRLTAMLLVPALFLIALEGGLRAIDYGTPTDFFTAAPGPDMVATNERFGWRFFPPAIARTPTAERLQRHKPDGVYRIFVLGGSAAQGTPSHAFNFERILEVMLRERYPGVRFEVINVAMTAINSHVVLPIARECARLEPDLLLIYMGNNEVVGPYGAGTVFAGFSPNLIGIRASIALRTTGIGKLLHGLAARLSPPKTAEWGGLKMFENNHVSADDPRLARVYDHFQRNLRDICRAGLDAGANVLVSTVAVNLRDNPPFGSQHRPDLTDEDLARFKAHVAAADAAEATDDLAGALAAFQQALTIDDGYAESHYRLGHILLALGRINDAASHFRAARDLDTLRFRADSRINAIIRETAASLAAGEAGDSLDTPRVFLADVEQAIGHAAEITGLPGDEFFQEHVHPHFAGDWRIAAVLFDALVPQLPASVTTHQVDTALPDMNATADALGYSDWSAYENRSQILDLMTQAPFTAQWNHDARLAREMERLRHMAERGLTADALAAAEQGIRATLDRHPDDIQLRILLAQVLQKQNKVAEELRQWEWLVERIPNIAWWQDRLAVALSVTGKSDQALAVFDMALQLDPNRADTYYNYGTALIRLGRTADARDRFLQAIAHKSTAWIYHFNLANSYRQLGENTQSITALQDALAIEPRNTRILHALGWFLIEDGHVQPGLEHLRHAAELSDAYVDDLAWAQAERQTAGAGLVARGAALLRQGAVADAQYLFALALRRNPQLAAAHYWLANIAISQRRLPQAAASLRAAAKLAPRDVDIAALQGQVHHWMGDATAAIADYETVLTLDPDHLPTLRHLAYLYATHPMPSLRNGGRAVTLARHAIELTDEDKTNSAALLDVLAAAYAEIGDFAKAVSTLEQAIAIAQAREPAALPTLERHLAAFRAGRPWREGPPRPAAP